MTPRASLCGGPSGGEPVRLRRTQPLGGKKRKDARTQNELQFESGPIVTGAILFGVGGLLAFIGLVIGGSHAFTRVMHWVQTLEDPPGEVAKTKWNQVKAARAASAGAGKDSMPSVLAPG
jgi:hypothetical protein